MSFNRAVTGRSMTIKVSSSSTKHTMNRELKENISPLVGFGTLKSKMNHSFVAESSSTRSQPSRKPAKQTTLPIERYKGNVRTQKLPLQELKNFKFKQQNSKNNSNRARSSQNFTSKRNSNQSNISSRYNSRALTLEVSPIGAKDESSSANKGPGVVDNFDLIRQLISPVAEDTKQFLEQISLQLKNLPSSSEEITPSQSQRIVPQPHPLKDLNLSSVSDHQHYLTSHEDTEDMIMPQKGSKAQGKNRSESVQISQGALSGSERPQQEMIDTASAHDNSQRGSSLRLTLLNQRQRMKNQFDYASLIDHKQSSLKHLNSTSEQSSEHRATDQNHNNTQRNEPISSTFQKENEGAIVALKDNYVASLDQLITEEDKIAERLQQQILRNDSDEYIQQTTSRFKNPKTASVATFGQQGNSVNVGQSCTSPTETLSPPNNLENSSKYWKMEEKQQHKSTTENVEAFSGQRRANRQIKKVGSSSSVINKYINAAVERQQRTSQLVQPILNQKRTASMSSHQSLRISTQPSECLSQRSRRIGPSSTSTVGSQMTQNKKEGGPKSSTNRANRMQQPKARTYLQTETSQQEQQQQPVEPRMIARLQNRGKRSVSKAQSNNTQTSASKSVTSKNSKKPTLKPAVPRQNRFSNNAVNILHSQPSLKKINRTQKPASNSRTSSKRQRSDSSSQQTVVKRSSSRQSSSQASRMRSNSRTSSRKKNKSPVPDLVLNKNGCGVESLNGDIGKFIDQTEDDAEEPALANLRAFQTRLIYVGKKIDYYARFVTIKKIREFSQHEKPGSTAYMKAGRALCLLMKAFTCMDNNFRQIKEDEIFEGWTKIQQYLNSDQGEKQIKRFSDLRQFCELHSKFCDKQTLLVDLRKTIFRYTLASQAQGSMLTDTDLESPRVKTSILKPIFCLAYFTMTYVTLQEQIVEQLRQLETLVHEHEAQLEQAMLDAEENSPEKKLSCSPDVNKLGIANIAINTTCDQALMNSSQGTVKIKAIPMDFGTMILSNNSHPSSTSHSRGSIIRCTPKNIISPPTDGDRASAATSGFFNQAHQMEMFGSHFKVDANGLEDSATPAVNAELDNYFSRLPMQQVSEKRTAIENAQRPISTIEEHPTNSSFLQQSSQGGCNVIGVNEFELDSRPDTALSGNSSQVGGHPSSHHHLSNEAGQSINEQNNNSLLMGSGIVPQKQFRSVTTYAQPQYTQTSQPSHKTSEFTFYQSHMYQSQLKDLAQMHSQSRQSPSLNQQCSTYLNNLTQCQDPGMLNDYDESPTWQDHNKENDEDPQINNFEKNEISPSSSLRSINEDESQKMTAFIEDSMMQNRGAEEQQIKVDELLKRVRSASPLLDQSTSMQERASLEQAFDQFYQDAAQMTASAYQSNQLPTENVTMLQEEDEAADESPLQINFDLEKHDGQLTQLNQMQSKMLRSTQEILSSIKKRRLNNVNERVSGFDLQDLADQIIEQCKISIQALSLDTHTEIKEEENYPKDSVSEQIKCITLTRQSQEQDQQCEEDDEMVRTPDTPPFNDMKRVFGSNDFDAANNNNLMSTGGAITSNNEVEYGGDVTERVVAFRKPDSMLDQDDYDCDEDEYEAEAVLREEEEQVKFATLEASYPTHIQQESSTMCCGGDQSGRQLIQEEDEDMEYY